MVTCGFCGKGVPEQQMQGGLPGIKFMPMLLYNEAMKCDRCGVWMCAECVSNKAAESMGGPIRHPTCGGMFLRP
jgi:hypothetical protein